MWRKKEEYCPCIIEQHEEQKGTLFTSGRLKTMWAKREDYSPLDNLNIDNLVEGIKE
jgi:hypothetical protein